MNKKMALPLCIIAAICIGGLCWYRDAELKKIAQTPIFSSICPLKDEEYFRNPVILEDGQFLAVNHFGEVETIDLKSCKKQILKSFNKKDVYRIESTTSLSNNQILITGANPRQNLFFSKIYDISRNTYYDTAPMNVQRTGFSAIKLEDGILIAGGKYQDKEINTIEIFNPKLNGYELMPAKLFETGKAVKLSDNQILFLGNRLQILNSKTGKIRTLGAWDNGNKGFSSLKLNDGRVLILYSSKPPQFQPDGVIFDPDKETFSPLYGSYNPGLMNRTMNLLPDGKVLIAGAYSCGTLQRCSYGPGVVELFYPAKNTFEIIGRTKGEHLSINTIIHDHKLYLIGDGIGLGGSIELYKQKI